MRPLGISGAAAVALGAIGAHALKSKTEVSNRLDSINILLNRFIEKHGKQLLLTTLSIHVL